MLKIGDFSRLAHVTVKTLRHYGKEGLLKPAWIDRFTGYRYYSLQQLPRLNRILALKDLGFTLDQIRPMLDAGLQTAELRDILNRKQQELVEQVQLEQSRLVQVESRLTLIEKEGSLPTYEVVLKRLEVQTIASMRTTVAAFEATPQVWDRVRSNIGIFLKEKGLKLEGPWFVIYHEPEFTDRNINVEMGAVVEAVLPRRLNQLDSNGISVRRLAGADCAASVLHTADFSLISPAYAALFDWIESHAYRRCGPLREIILEEVNADGKACRMIEVQAPVERLKEHRPASTRIGQEDNKMEMKIVERPAFMVWGMKYVGKNQNQEISQMWDVYNRRMDEMKVPPQPAAYGVCNWVEGAEEGVFEYVAGIETKGMDNLPEGFVLRMVPAHRYAVFAHHGKLDTLMDTYRNIYQVWIPEAGFKLHPDRFDMEVYDEAFKLGSDDSLMWIYVAVE